MPFTDPFHRAGEAWDGDPRFKRRSETAGSAFVEELPRQIVLAVPPSGNFRATMDFESVPLKVIQG
jgi:hypothetical protein